MDQTRTELLKTIAHPTRLAVLDILRDGEQCVCHMEAMLGVRQAYISQQLMVLREAGLVDVRRDGLNLYYRLIKPGILPLLDAVDSALGLKPKKIGHKHAALDCPCPKCETKKTHSVTLKTIPMGRR
jgi:ArsR family transcriptional regulator